MSVFSSSLQELVRESAARAGFESSGVAGVCEDDFRELAFFEQWIEKGYAGEMNYLKARNEAGDLKRSSINNAVPWGRSLIVCALNYNTGQPYSTAPAKSHEGWISRYAWGAVQDGDTMAPTDYHQTLMQRLKKVEEDLKRNVNGELQTRCYVDTGPLIERIYAKYAGLGWIGKNTCLISQQLGSWLFLGVIITSLMIPTENGALIGLEAPDRCGSCTRCLDACPTNAFVAPYQMDASRCISYLTIEKRGAIASDLRAKMGRQVFGCDICQDVCPWNRRAAVTSKAEFQANPKFVNPDLAELAQMSEEKFRQVFKGSPVKRTKYSGMRRNVVIAMGNSGDPAFVSELDRLRQSEDPVVAEHAAWALQRLHPQGSHPEEK